MVDLRGQVALISDPEQAAAGNLYVFDGSSVEKIDAVGTTGLARLPDDRFVRLLRASDEPQTAGDRAPNGRRRQLRRNVRYHDERLDCKFHETGGTRRTCSEPLRTTAKTA